MKYIICADVHMRETEYEKQRVFKQLLATLTHDDIFIIAGDLCDALVGVHELMWPWQREFLGLMTAVRSGGTRVLYVEGNRDFFLDYLKGVYFDDVYRERCLLEDGAMLVVHGDLINHKDYWYRCWRAIVKSRLVFRMVRLVIPGPMLLRIIFWLEKRMKKLNQHFKNKIPMVEIERFIGSCKETPRIIASGHFHEYINHSFSKSVFVSIPSWDEYPNIVYVELDKESVLHKLEKL
jgi:UDP-2,3-diacylglucosamine hydrolase